jgi:hypothetical protein
MLGSSAAVLGSGPWVAAPRAAPHGPAGALEAPRLPEDGLPHAPRAAARHRSRAPGRGRRRAIHPASRAAPRGRGERAQARAAARLRCTSQAGESARAGGAEWRVQSARGDAAGPLSWPGLANNRHTRTNRRARRRNGAPRGRLSGGAGTGAVLQRHRPLPASGAASPARCRASSRPQRSHLRTAVAAAALRCDGSSARGAPAADQEAHQKLGRSAAPRAQMRARRARAHACTGAPSARRGHARARRRAGGRVGPPKARGLSRQLSSAPREPPNRARTMLAEPSARINPTLHINFHLSMLLAGVGERQPARCTRTGPLLGKTGLSLGTAAAVALIPQCGLLL